MKKKLAVIFSLFILLTVSSNFYYKAVEPNVQTELLFEQLEKPSALNSAKVRNVRNFDPFPYLYGGLIIVSGFMLWSDAKKFYEEKVNG